MSALGFAEIVTEYVCIILLLSLISGRDIRPTPLKGVISVAYLAVMCGFQYRNSEWFAAKVLAYILLFLFIRDVCTYWKRTVMVFCKTWLSILILQVVFYYLLKILTLGHIDDTNPGVVVNTLLCLTLFTSVRKKFIPHERIKKYSPEAFMLILSVFLMGILYILNTQKPEDIRVILFVTMTLLMTSITMSIWLQEVNERQVKERELHVYKIYNESFENAIESMRMRQHEFNNHLTAIKGLTYAASSLDDLAVRQQDYISSVVDMNQFDRLLRSSVNPIIKGFLYSKFLDAVNKQITIDYEVLSNTAVQDIVPICEQIELIGVLLDNAIEALETRSIRKLIVKITADENGVPVISIANNSDRVKNSEIEKMFQNGYTTKGETRGVGLSRVRDIADRYRMRLTVENVLKDNENYLWFCVGQ